MSIDRTEMLNHFGDLLEQLASIENPTEIQEALVALLKLLPGRTNSDADRNVRRKSKIDWAVSAAGKSSFLCGYCNETISSRIYTMRCRVTDFKAG